MMQAPERPRSSVPPGLRPSPARAAAAARLMAGSGESGPSARAHRLRHGARAAGLATTSGVATAAALAEKAVPWSRPSAPGEREGRPRHLRVVEPRTLSPAQRRRRARALLLAGVGLATAVAFALVYLHVLLAQRQFRLDRMNSQVQANQTNYQRIRLNVAQLGSPQHIISTAVGQLGMVQPNKVTYLTPSSTIPTALPHTSSNGTSGQAPAGDADWPLVKSQLAGTP
ncbi:MAG: hypothetical protein JO337_02970 [Acidimicrobiales bacterium]|nr:hypothetical protein [Acidimicrobiales bacterium]